MASTVNPVLIKSWDDRVVSRSKNLRGILDYSRKYRVAKVRIWPNNPAWRFPYPGSTVSTVGDSEGARFEITWENGSTCLSDFASATVCGQFFRHRMETFRIIEIYDKRWASE